MTGRHTWQFGFDGRRYISPQTFTQRSRGDYEYNTLQLFLQDITPDAVAQRSLGSATYWGNQTATYEYAQDTWRYRPNLTFNLGLRYEYTTISAGEKTQANSQRDFQRSVDSLTFGDSTAEHQHNFAPRVGVAYSPGTSGTTSIRAGFGLAYDVLYDNIGILAVPPQVGTTVDITGNGAANFLANGGISPNTSGGLNCTSVAIVPSRNRKLYSQPAGAALFHPMEPGCPACFS